jgi:putative flippase GtrA
MDIFDPTFVIYFALQVLFDLTGIGVLALTIAYAVAIIYHFLMNRILCFVPAQWMVELWRLRCRDMRV